MNRKLYWVKVTSSSLMAISTILFSCQSPQQPSSPSFHWKCPEKLITIGVKDSPRNLDDDELYIDKDLKLILNSKDESILAIDNGGINTVNARPRIVPRGEGTATVNAVIGDEKSPLTTCTFQVKVLPQSEIIQGGIVSLPTTTPTPSPMPTPSFVEQPINDSVSFPTPSPQSSQPSQAPIISGTPLLSISHITSSSFELSWEPVTNVDHYKITLNGEPYRNDTRDKTTLSVIGLTSGTDYVVVVYAIGSDGKTVLSPEKKVITAPNAPDITVADKGIGKNSVTVRWKKVPGATDYRVYIDGAQHVPQPIEEDGSDFLKTTISELGENQKYLIAIGAARASSESRSAELSVITNPSIPTGLKATEIKANSLVVSWVQMERIKKYRVYVKGEFYKESFSNSTTVDARESATSYDITVSAINETDDGESEKSQPLTVLTATEKPSDVKYEPASVTNSSVQVTWTKPNGAKDFDIYNNGVRIPLTTKPTGTSYILTNLPSGSLNTIKVIAFNNNGLPSEPSEEISVRLKPAKPTGLTISQQTTNGFVLSWEPISGITYNIFENGIKVNSSTVSQPPFTFSGFSAGSKHELTIEAVNEAGSSDKSDIIYGYTNPNVPTNLRASTITSDSIELLWTPPTGSDTTYKYYVYKDGLPENSNGIMSSSYTVSGLSQNKQYRFEVVADYNGQRSEMSTSIYLSTATATTPTSGGATGGTTNGGTQITTEQLEKVGTIFSHTFNTYYRSDEFGSWNKEQYGNPAGYIWIDNICGCLVFSQSSNVVSWEYIKIPTYKIAGKIIRLQADISLNNVQKGLQSYETANLVLKLEHPNKPTIYEAGQSLLGTFDFQQVTAIQDASQVIDDVFINNQLQQGYFFVPSDITDAKLYIGLQNATGVARYKSIELSEYRIVK